MSVLQTILAKYREFSETHREQGDKFERLIQAYLKTTPLYSNDFIYVWLWREFPFKGSFPAQDIGIDLVAMTYSGDFWAIQCKFYAPTSQIDKGQLDSFLASSSKKFCLDLNLAKEQKIELPQNLLDMLGNKTSLDLKFSDRLLIYTGRLSSNAKEALTHQDPPIHCLDSTALENSRVDWDALERGIYGINAKIDQKSPLPHQIEAIENAHNYFQSSDRGKLIMACGTGKTFTSLRIAERENAQYVLFLVPSIALIAQSLREWLNESQNGIIPICICSDPEVSKNKKEEDLQGSIIDLGRPASTDVASIVKQFNNAKKLKTKCQIVFFSTYQSIQVVIDAQKELNIVFDLVICDEAHRTTGVKFKDEDAKAFIKVHDNELIVAKKRLYMTATPRLYNVASKAKAKENEAYLCSMDDPAIYGEEFYRIGFGKAVNQGLLTDYKMLVLAISEADLPPIVQDIVAKDQEINTDDLAKLIGCINALSKKMRDSDANLLTTTDPGLMRKAVAFCQSIPSSKKIVSIFNDYKEQYYSSLSPEVKAKIVDVFADHVDGNMGANTRQNKLDWLNFNLDNNEPDNACHILCNVRCLSEGVDVPSLDAVLFLASKTSQIEIVQSVGRVMRKAPNKKYGYIIVPVLLPTNAEPEKILEDNQKFGVIWDVANALRAHDERFEAMINKINLNNKLPTGGGSIIFGFPDNEEEGAIPKTPSGIQLPLITAKFKNLQNILYARLVQKVGNRRYWEQWATDVADIATNYIERINHLIATSDRHQHEFQTFLKHLQQDINSSITQAEVVEMLAQHLITKPVFEALFENYSFVQENPVSKSMQNLIEALEDQGLDKEREVLSRFYESVKLRVEGIDNATGRQRVIIELYDKFFKVAFPKTVERLGIVYTPVEIVDFINQSVADILEAEFGTNISSDQVDILDPFSGTGTFLTRLIESGLINKTDLKRKYLEELHANEIVLLAYYISSVNIENAFHDAMGDSSYTSFAGMSLTDTFNLAEPASGITKYSNNASQASLLPYDRENLARIQRQQSRPIQVIIGNPPYSAGQKSANDNAQNLYYPELAKRVEETYVKNSNAQLTKGVYDSYIKAFRWASDRLGKVHSEKGYIEAENKNGFSGGVIAFITNGYWLDGSAMDGFRKCLEQEFSEIYVFNLRGGIRAKIGDLARKEGQNVFNIMTQVAITILVNKPKKAGQKATIYYYDIGDYLTREQKLAIVTAKRSVLNSNFDWQILQPDHKGDWINQGLDIFDSFIKIGDNKEKNSENKFFFIYSSGLNTSRSAWCYNFSNEKLATNIKHTIDFYNQQMIAYKEAIEKDSSLKVIDFVDNDETKISWSQEFRDDIIKGITKTFNKQCLRKALYRPFNISSVYFDHDLNERQGQLLQIFPTPAHNNLVICIPNAGNRRLFSVLITNLIPDLSVMDAVQCFPLYYYKQEAEHGQFTRYDAITDYILAEAKTRYPEVASTITKEDLFYYVYGILHSTSYRETFSADLKKSLPRLPLVDSYLDFKAFSQAGRQLAELHLNYENYANQATQYGVSVEALTNITLEQCSQLTSNEQYQLLRVTKLRFAKKAKSADSVKSMDSIDSNNESNNESNNASNNKFDKSIIHYNNNFVIKGIPLKAYNYVINGRSAIEWIINRYEIKTDKKSLISNDPNDWTKAVNNPRYILDLLLSLIVVSIESLAIIEKLPEIEFKQ